MLKKALIVGVGALALFALNAQAVEDGRGTNVVKNIRVQNNGVIDLGNVSITNWLQVGSTAGVAKLQGDLIVVSNQADNAAAMAAGLQTRSNAWDATTATVGTKEATWDGAAAIADGLNTRSGTWDNAATTAADAKAIADGLNTRSNAWDGAAAVAAGLNTRSSTWDNAATTAADAKAIADGLNTQSSTWSTVVAKLDRKDGTATNLTVEGLLIKNALTQVPSALQSIGADGESIDPTGVSFVEVESDATGPHTASIVAGAAGQRLLLQGAVSSVNIVTITNNPPNVNLAEGVAFAMNTNDVLELISNSSGQWTEINRVDN